ncbi:MAG: DUF4266 domain-containing protein [Lewinellaceae bacterium]|nr:DUF4266 domain-containing protein [Saprospiraceae bacterium]MCB9330132.1 DUF4266 domain-containing protein [Lewinellaceae bacterium]
MWTHRHRFFCLPAILLLLAGIVGCRPVKPYQRAYLNDRNMQSGVQKDQKLEQSVHSYREGAVGGRPGKAAGGCGCN